MFQKLLIAVPIVFILIVAGFLVFRTLTFATKGTHPRRIEDMIIVRLDSLPSFLSSPSLHIHPHTTAASLQTPSMGLAVAGWGHQAPLCRMRWAPHTATPTQTHEQMTSPASHLAVQSLLQTHWHRLSLIQQLSSQQHLQNWAPPSLETPPSQPTLEQQSLSQRRLQLRSFNLGNQMSQSHLQSLMVGARPFSFSFSFCTNSRTFSSPSVLGRWLRVWLYYSIVTSYVLVVLSFSYSTTLQYSLTTTVTIIHAS